MSNSYNVHFSNGVISFRVYDLIIKVATYSDSAFEACELSGLLSVFIKELQSDDLLVKINAIELLNEVRKRKKGIPIDFPIDTNLQKYERIKSYRLQLLLPGYPF